MVANILQQSNQKNPDASNYNTSGEILAALTKKYPKAPGELLDWMAADLGGSAIATNIATMNFKPIWDPEKIAEFLGWKSYSGDPGWIAGGQFKPMKPIAFPDGKTAKYLTSKEKEYDAAILKGIDWKAIADDPTEAIYITEGAKKAAALISQGLPAISLPGVDMGHPYDRLHFHPPIFTSDRQ